MECEPSGLTTSRNPTGTTRYLSPELLEDDTPHRTLKSDVWAWACVFVEVRCIQNIGLEPLLISKGRSWRVVPHIHGRKRIRWSSKPLCKAKHRRPQSTPSFQVTDRHCSEIAGYRSQHSVQPWRGVPKFLLAGAPIVRHRHGIMTMFPTISCRNA